jgi:hypothetical protein
VQALVKRSSACLSARKEMTARCRGSKGRQRAVTTRSGSFLDSSGLAKMARSHGRTPPPPAPPLSLLLDVTSNGLGRGIPSWLGLVSGARGASYRLR